MQAFLEVCIIRPYLEWVIRSSVWPVAMGIRDWSFIMGVGGGGLQNGKIGGTKLFGPPLKMG